jgi:di/tricarboxylate transporter
MTLQQAIAFAIVAGMMAMFFWGKLRYDLVAVLTLLIAIAAGIVPHEKAFSGFSDDIVIIVASALVVSAAVARSGVIERIVHRVDSFLTQTGRQVVVLSSAVAVLSAFVKNIGALAMLMPVAFQLARKHGTPVSALLMPMSFAALLGGIVTLIGTSPNIIVSRVREQELGTPFQMFDFTLVGIGIALAGLLFLSFGWKLLPTGRKSAASIDAAFNLEGYTTEVVIPEKASVAGKTVKDLENFGENEIEVVTILRTGGRRHYAPRGAVTLKAGDILILQGEPSALEKVVNGAGLKLSRDHAEHSEDTPTDDIGVMEAVITPESELVDRSPLQARLFDRFDINLLAVSRRGKRITGRLRTTALKAGDVVVLRGNLTTLPETLGFLQLLPLAQRKVGIGSNRTNLLPLVVLLSAMALVAFHLVPVPIAFFGAAVFVLIVKALTLREAYDAIEWPILIMLGALIPVSDSLRSTGGTDLIAAWLSAVTTGLPALATLALMIVVSMAVTPFLNNAATVLVVAPIAVGFAKNLGLSPDPFLMAVAIGAACDFLTPIGHQCNTLVMGPGGYRFGDYWRLGLPLSIIVIVVGTLLIPLAWPLGG